MDPSPTLKGFSSHFYVGLISRVQQTCQHGQGKIHWPVPWENMQSGLNGFVHKHLALHRFGVSLPRTDPLQLTAGIRHHQRRDLKQAKGNKQNLHKIWMISKGCFGKEGTKRKTPDRMISKPKFVARISLDDLIKLIDLESVS